MCCFPDQVLVLLRANFPSRAINENDGNGRGGAERYDGDDKDSDDYLCQGCTNSSILGSRDGDDKDNDDCWILGSGDGFLHKIRFKRDQIGL